MKWLVKHRGAVARQLALVALNLALTLAVVGGTLSAECAAQLHGVGQALLAAVA